MMTHSWLFEVRGASEHEQLPKGTSISWLSRISILCTFHWVGYSPLALT